jgi:hypothetical protein
LVGFRGASGRAEGDEGPVAGDEGEADGFGEFDDGDFVGRGGLVGDLGFTFVHDRGYLEDTWRARDVGYVDIRGR